MRLEEILAFLEVAECGSLTKAAELLYITQPTLTNQIKNLEEELGVQLIIRHKGQRQIELTPEGIVFVGQAEKWRRLWTDTQNLFNNPIKKKMRIATSHSLSYAFHDVYRKFVSSHKLLNVSMTTSGSIDMYRRIDCNELDMAMLCGARFYNDIVSQPVAYEKLVFCCARNSSYGYMVNVRDLDISKQVCIIWNTDFRQWQSYWMNAKGTPLLETEGVLLLPDYLVGDNWAILPISVARSPELRDIIRICELDETPKERTLYLVSKNPSKTPYYEEFLNDIKTVLGGKEGFTVI